MKGFLGKPQGNYILQGNQGGKTNGLRAVVVNDDIPLQTIGQVSAQHGSRQDVGSGNTFGGRSSRGPGGGAPGVGDLSKYFTSFLKIIAKVHYFSVFFKAFTSIHLGFARLPENSPKFGSFEKILKLLQKIEFLTICGKAVAKIEHLGLTSFFYDNCSHFWGTDVPSVSPWRRL